MTTDAPDTLVALLDWRADDDTTGLLVDDGEWSWREVVAESGRWAAALAELRPADGPFHVGALLGNVPEYLFLLFGAARAGAVLVGINDSRRGEELARDVRHTDCVAVLTDATHAPLLAGLDLGDTAVIEIGSPRWQQRLAEAMPVEPPEIGPTDVLLLIFTSGSTGAPKAVQLSHGRAARIANAASWIAADDVLYCAMPLFHGNALNAVVFPAAASGATIALRERFSASQFMPDIRRYGATFFSTVGRALAYILATPESPEDREHRVKFALAPESSPRDMRAFKDRFGILCVAGYGSSENVIIMEPRPGLPKDALGFPQAGVDAAVVDPETGVERARARFDASGRLVNGADAIGEIVGRNVVERFEGYYRNPEAEAERTRNGWYWSGDLGYVDETGVFYFAGRAGEWLRVDSENFATAPVERIVGRFPGANGVAVYPVPDERTADDQIMLALELDAGAAFDPDAFGRFLAEQPDLGTKWSPRYVRVTTLPVGATNKIDKRPLRAERWYTADPVYWRPGPEPAYRRFTADDLAALETRFREFGRPDAIGRP
ncbi:MAG TPA: AMP-binding protein [Acidimicrobiia bacterium]